MKGNGKVKEKHISNSNNYKSQTEMEKLETLNIIDENKKLINKARFIKIIKFILSVIIFCIICIYLITTVLQNSIIENMQQFLITYYYSLYTKNLLLGVHSIILNIYYDSFILEKQYFSEDIIILNSLTYDLKDKYHNYTSAFYDYNLAIGHNRNLLFKKKILQN